MSTLSGVDANGNASNLISGIPVDTGGRHVDVASASWHTADGKQLSRGQSVDLRVLPEGRTNLELFVQTRDSGHVRKSWTVERAQSQFRIVSEGQTIRPIRSLSHTAEKH